MLDLQPPYLTDIGWLIKVLTGSLIVFHLLFVWPRNLSEPIWKAVDYIWFGMALIGVIGVAGEGRQAIAQNLLTTADLVVNRFVSEVESDLRLGASIAVCRQFVRSEYSPPQVNLDQSQREFDAQCAWFTQASEAIKNFPFEKRQPLRLEDLGGHPPRGGEERITLRLRESITNYNAAISQFERLSRDRGETQLERNLILIGPFLLVAALALRISKVTGELRHMLK